ncbi:MAG: hypothetical protein IIA88_04805, partial [Bacteroidetes bacterium]|nr:hypothetical protein [Bacteroidota bacterium]
MEMIKFNSNKYQETILYSSKPVINIIRINYLTNVKDWVNRLNAANLSVKISALGKDDKEIASIQEFLSFGAYITPYHKQPVLETNQTFKFSTDLMSQDHSNCNKWKVDIILNNINFDENETLTIEYMDSKYIERRVDDWERRVHDFIENLTKWSAKKNNIEVRASRKQKMHEGMMKDFGVLMREIESADVLKNGKIIFALKPFGLWIMGT